MKRAIRRSDELMPHPHQSGLHGDPWMWAKDGKCRFDAERHPALMRK